MKKLKTDYVDLLLIHQPFGDYYGTYRAMEEAYKAGKARAIGVSNFYPDRYIDIAHFAEVVPAVNQVETHLFQQQKVAREYLAKHNTQIMSWGPFAEGKITAKADDPKAFAYLYDELVKIITQYQPKILICEQQFTGRNMNVTIKLARPTGLVLAAAGLLDSVDFHFMPPMKWRKIYHTGTDNR